MDHELGNRFEVKGHQEKWINRHQTKTKVIRRSYTTHIVEYISLAQAKCFVLR